MKLFKMKYIYTILILLLFAACLRDDSNSKYLRWVGDSKFDAATDKEAFELCLSEKRVQQYFKFGVGFQYEGEKKALVRYFMENYKPVNTEQSGLIRIRFIVNCKGETGRFRLTSSDQNYKQLDFDESITNQLLEITKKLDGWKILSLREKPRDYYQYLVFKIDNGKLKEIMP